jgi:membrane fusion protein, multidrug efflux system
MQRIQEITRAKSALTRAALLLSLAALLAGCGSEAKVSQEVVRPVKVAIAGEATYGRTVRYSGVVRPRIESSVGFRVAGKIVERLVNVGDRVEADQVIARLDDTDLRLAENSAKAAVDSARSRRDIARDNLERGKALLPQATRSCGRLRTPSPTQRSRPTRLASSRR